MTRAPSIHLVMMTYNRLDYTREALPALLADPEEDFVLTIWDNGSTDGTREFIRQVSDPRVVEVVLSDENKGQAYVTNKIWEDSEADLVGKVDNDCVVTPGWTRPLARAHADLPELGVVGCWHFFAQDFDLGRARHKIQRFGDHQIFRHPWIDGSALLVKRKVFLEYAPCREEEYLSGFWTRLALDGYVNGFYYPLILQDHLDDPLHPRCMIRDAHGFAEHRAITQGLKAKRYDDPEGRLRWRREIVRNLLDDPYDPRYYAPWRARWRRLVRRLAPGRS